MRCKDICLALAPALIAAAPLVAGAQNDPEGDIDQCRSLSAASRTRANACGNDDSGPATAEQELSLTITLERPAIEFTQCAANMAIDYVQMGEVASVDGVIRNETCAASGGEYTIEARIRDENGESSTLEFPEKWQRDDDQPFVFSTEYPIGENVELIRVRTHGLRCECAAPPAQSEPAPGQ